MQVDQIQIPASCWLEKGDNETEISSWKIIARTCAIVLLVSCSAGAQKCQDMLSGSGHAEIPQSLRWQSKKNFRERYLKVLRPIHCFSVGMTTEQILWAQPSRVDHITITIDKAIHPEIEGPFTLL
jgi:hypothetical protein